MCTDAPTNTCTANIRTLEKFLAYTFTTHQWEASFAMLNLCFAQNIEISMLDLPPPLRSADDEEMCSSNVESKPDHVFDTYCQNPNLNLAYTRCAKRKNQSRTAILLHLAETGTHTMKVFVLHQVQSPRRGIDKDKLRSFKFGCMLSGSTSSIRGSFQCHQTSDDS